KRAEAVEADFKEIAAQDARYEVEFEKSKELEKIRQGWTNLKNNLPRMSLDQAVGGHTSFLRSIQQFTILIGNASNLILDPDVDSYYLVNALIFTIPKLTEEVSVARSLGVAYTASGGQGEMNTRRRLALAESAVKIGDALAQENDFVRFARDFNPHVNQVLAGVGNDNNDAVTKFNSTLVDRIVNGSGEVMPAKDYYAAASAPLDSSAKVWDAGIAELDRLLAERNAARQK